MPLESGTTVQVHYRGKLEDGTEFDTSYGGEPLQFTLGAGQVIPGFEEAVSQMGVGEKQTVTLPPEKAYGDHVDEAVQSVDKSAFNEEPYLGGVVDVVSPEGQHLRATITGVEDDEVVLDFNHPLAGKPLTFELEVVGAA